jgi:hypothetical protein
LVNFFKEPEDDGPFENKYLISDEHELEEQPKPSPSSIDRESAFSQVMPLVT